MLNLPSVYPAEECPEVTLYLVQLHIFHIKLRRVLNKTVSQTKDIGTRNRRPDRARTEDH